MKNTAAKIKNNKAERNKVIFIAPAIVIIWLLIIYALKDIFPFGDGTIVQYDLQYGVVPSSYYHLWDAFHGGNLFYDFTTACGFGRSMLTQLFYPTNIFILLLKREWIYNGVSILLILKLAVIAFTSSYAFGKIFPKLPSCYTLLITVMYTFCGYNLMYYTNIDWLDTVALYPLIVLFALNMFKGKSKLPYFFALAYTLTFNTYMAWFVVISLVVFGGTYIFTLESKENRKNDIYRLGIGTGAALIASAYSLYGFYRGITGGARYGKGNYYFDSVTGTTVESNGLKAILKTPVQIDIISVLMFLGFACAISFYILLLARSVKNKSIRKAALFFTVALVFLILEAVINGCLLLWHGGSFQHFPYRNGYMVAFFCCLITGYYLSHFADAKGLNFKKDIFNLLPFAICIFLAVGILAYANVFYFALKHNFTLLNGAIKMQAGSFLYPYSRFVIILIATYIVLQIIKYKKTRGVLTVALALTLTVMNTYRLLGTVNVSTNAIFTEQISEALSVGKKYKQNNELERINNPKATTVINYGYWGKVATLSNWTHSLSDTQLSAFDSLGFSHDSTIQYDSGGTQFSKALLRITDSFSDFELDNMLYNKQGETDGLNFYDNKYTLPLGVCFDKSITETEFEKSDNIFEYQNDIYNNITRKSKLFIQLNEKAVETFEEKELFKNEEDENGEKHPVKFNADCCICNYSLKIEGEKALYIQLTNEDAFITDIKINGVLLPIFNSNSYDTINSESSEESIIFPASNNKNVLELGAFKDETVNIEIKFYDENGSSDDILLYTMDLEKMQELCDSLPENDYTVEGDTVRFSTTAKNDGDIVFVPLGYEDKWNCTVNGETVKPVCILGDFIGIEVNAGKNDIVLSYSHTQAYILLASIFIGFAVGIALLMLEKKYNNKIPEFVYTVMGVLFTLIYGGAVGILYIIPTGYTVVSKIIELII